MGNRRPKLPPETEKAVLVKSARRCCLCYGLEGDQETKKGQIAHLDRNRQNNKEDNLAWFCFDHHDEYDCKTSQSKNFTITEAKHYRDKLHAKVAQDLHFSSKHCAPGGLEIVDVDFLETRNERRKPEEYSSYSILKDVPEYAGYFEALVNNPKPKAGELPVLDVKLRNTGTEVALLKKAVIHVEKLWRIIPFTICFSELTVSANYDVLIPNREPPFVVETKLSQVVHANDVDRLTFTLYPEKEACIFLASLELLYDSDDKSLISNAILFAMRGHDYEFRTLSPSKLRQISDERLRENYALNNTAMDAVKRTAAIRSNVVRAFEAGTL